MNYFTLQYDMKKYAKKGIMAYHSELNGIGMYEVTKGNIVENWDDKIAFYYTEAEGNSDTDYICNDLGWFIVSDKFKNAMEAMKIVGIQYLPLNLINKDNDKRLGDYYVANICNLIEAINMEKSEHIELGQGKYIFVSYAINEEKIRGLDIYRLKESNIPIFLSEKLKKIIKDYKLTGFSYTKIKVV